MIKSFKEPIFQRVELINITQSYPVLIIIKTNPAITFLSLSTQKWLNKTNNFKNDLKLV